MDVTGQDNQRSHFVTGTINLIAMDKMLHVNVIGHDRMLDHRTRCYKWMSQNKIGCLTTGQDVTSDSHRTR